MALPRSLTQVSFAGLLDESMQGEILDPSASFPVIVNGRQDRRGGLSKRLGYNPLSSTRVDDSARSDGRRCFAHNGAPCVVSGAGSVDVYSESLGSTVATGGKASACSVEMIYLGANVPVEAPAQYDAVVCNGFLVVAYSTYLNGSRGPKFIVQHASSPAVPLLVGDIDTAATPVFHLVALGTDVLCVFGNGSTGNLYLGKLDCSTTATVLAGWSYVATIDTHRATASYNLSVSAMSDRAVAAYVNDKGGASQITLTTFSAGGVIGTADINTSGATPDQVGVDASLDIIWLVWNEVLLVRASPFTSTFTPLTSVTTIHATAGLLSTRPPNIVSVSTSTAVAYWGPSSASSQVGRLVIVGMQQSGGTFTILGTTDGNGVNPAGKPASIGGRTYGLLSAADNYVGVSYSVMLGDLTDRSYTDATENIPPHAMLLPGLMATDMTCPPVTLSDGRTGYVVTVLRTASTRAYAVAAVDFSDINRWRPASHNGCTFLSGGLLSYLSTDRVQEASFLQTPENLTATDTGSLTGPTGDVSYVAVFEGADGASNVTISGVCAPVTLTATGKAVLVECNPLRITSRTDVRVAFYRTIAGGKVYYLVERVRAYVSGTGNVSISDETSDASLIYQPLLNGTGVLPGTGGAPLQHEAPPYCSDVVSYNGMLVVASGSDLWWSGQTIGGEGTWFSAEQFFVTVDGPGDITALAVQDGTLYAFKGTGIWAVGGEAPSDNGASGGLGTPRRIALDVGCINPLSVVTTSLGTFFLSHRGVELLTRGGSPVWIGEKIQSTLADWPNVTSAVLDARNNLVRFTLAKSILSTGLVQGYSQDLEPPYTEVGGGRDIVFDLTLNDWQSVDDKTGTTSHEASQDACVVWNGIANRYAWLGADGVLHLESDSHLDDETWVTMSVETGWFKAAGIQGQQQVNRLLAMMRMNTGADISIALGYNYNESYESATTWTRAQIDTLLGSQPITRLRHDPSDNADGMAVRARITDAQPSTGSVDSGRGLTWIALTLDISPKDGPADVPEGAS